MLTIEKSKNIHRTRLPEVARRFRYVYLLRIDNRRIVVVSNRVSYIPEMGIVNIIEERKIPLHIVDMNLRMGKGFKTHEKSAMKYRYILESRNSIDIFEVYEIVNG